MDGSGNMEAAINELDDLGNLFEFGDIDLNNIPDVDTGNYGEQLQQPPSQHGTNPSTPFQDLGDPLLSASAVADFAGQEQMGMMRGMDQQDQHHFLGQSATQMPSSHAYISESMYQPAVSQAHQSKDFHFNGHPSYPPANHIPPTPNSYEMHGRAGAFMGAPQQQQFYRATMEQQRYQMHKDAHVAFTPMASPAGTPQFHMLPEFTTPGAYFSPLSSPMIHAQNAQNAHRQPQAFVSHPNTAPSSAAPSPNDGNLDIDMSGSGASQDLPSRKSRRKIATPKSVASTARAKSSPTQKAQKRKPSKKASQNDLRRAVTSQPSSASLRQRDSSEAESTSPEPLSESAMGPPPRPGSTLAHSTTSDGQPAGEAQAVGAAATPKSLLQRRAPQHVANGQHSAAPPAQTIGDLGGLDDLSLPEAARPAVPAPINTQIATADDEGDTPRISARKTPKLDASSTPSSARPPSNLPSPAVGPSPAIGASTPAAILKDKKDAKGGRGSKKRGSISQNGSKNLPRISPSIKPLLPEGSPLHSSTQALLLASKSNYQNLLEGNHLPGVNYPDSLSTGLTSKRTSHKVAEQGRRNRINDALKEMQSLVPKPSPATKAAMKEAEASNEASPDGEDEKDGVDGGSKEESAAKSSNSKAATVELANEYIKKMQKDFAVRDAEMDVLRREIYVLRQKLGVNGVDGSGDETMDGVSPEAGEG